MAAESNGKADTGKIQPLPSTRAKQPQRSAYGDLATIEVGHWSAKQIFHVHKGLLSFYSGYFKAALGGSWAESSSGVIKLDTEDPLVFERFVLWLYTHKISDDTLVSGYQIIIDLWLFADRRTVPLLMNEMVNALHLFIADNWVVPTECLRAIYESTSERATLRRMLMWSISRTVNASLFSEKKDCDKWPRDALLEVLRLAVTDRVPILSKEQYKMVKMCPLYHDHEDGVSCADGESK